MIDRFNVTLSGVTIAAAVANSTEILFGPYAGATFFVPAGSSLTSITWYAADVPGGTYLPVYDENSVLCRQTVAAGQAYQLPTALFGCRAIKGVDAGGGTISITPKG
jgi:hypothetical protein